MNISSRRESSLQQTLSTKFRKIPGTFCLTELGMKVLYILKNKPDYTATIQEIK